MQENSFVCYNGDNVNMAEIWYPSSFTKKNRRQARKIAEQLQEYAEEKGRIQRIGHEKRS